MPGMRVLARSVFIGVIVAMKRIFVALSRSPASSAIESLGIKCAIEPSRDSSGPCNNAAAVHDFAGVATSSADAPTALRQVNGRCIGGTHLNVHYAFPDKCSASTGIYNLCNMHAAARDEDC